MSGFWNKQNREREFQYNQRQHNQNRYDNQQQFNSFGYDTSNFSRFPPDRSRARKSYVENNFNAALRRDRNWGRRSASAPRDVAPEERGRWNPNRGRPRKQSFSNDANGEKLEREDRSKDHNANQAKDTPQVPQLKKFKNIFCPESTTNVSKVIKTSDVDLQIDHIVTCLDLEKSTETPDAPDKNGNLQNINPNGVESLPTRRVYLQSSENNDLTKYYGESLNDLKNEELKLQNTKVPIVDWPKKSFSIDDIPEYDPSVSVGGEGLTLEVYYLCKYCQMFTGGSQIEAHLKTRYHYDKYKEFLRTGQIASDSSSSSSQSSSECESKTTKSPRKEVETQSTNQTLMDIDDPSEIDYRCHQDLDFD